jgi:hypothetical protein
MRRALTSFIALALIALIGAGCGSGGGSADDKSSGNPLPAAQASDEDKALAGEINGCLTDAGLTASVVPVEENLNIRSNAEVHVELGKSGEKYDTDNAQILIFSAAASASETADGLNQSDKRIKHVANGKALLQYPKNLDTATVKKLETCVL